MRLSNRADSAAAECGLEFSQCDNGASDETINFDGASGSDEQRTVGETTETTEEAEATEVAEDKSGGFSLPLLGGLALLLLAVVGAVVFLFNRNRA